MLKTRTRTKQTLPKNIRLFQHHNQTKKYKISSNNIKRDLNIKKTWIGRPYGVHIWTFTWLYLLQACWLWTVIFLLFFFLFPFHYVFLPKLVRPSMLFSWTFTPESFHNVFLHIFSLILFLFSRGIYTISQGFLMDSNINWSKLSPLIKMREFWTNINNWNLCPSMVLGWWFCNKFA
jgi:hypothetical protein